MGRMTPMLKTKPSIIGFLELDLPIILSSKLKFWKYKNIYPLNWKIFILSLKYRMGNRYLLSRTPTNYPSLQSLHFAKHSYTHCSGDFLWPVNCPNPFPESSLLSKNHRLLVKSQVKFFHDTSSLRKKFSTTLQVSHSGLEMSLNFFENNTRNL